MLLSVPASAVLVVLDSGAGESTLELRAVGVDSGAGESRLELIAVGVDSRDSVTVTVDVISLSTRVVYTVVAVLAKPRRVKNCRR